VTISGRQYASLRRPLFEVGSMLEAAAIHDGRSAHNHLLCVAQSNGIGRRRVDEVLGMVGLTSVANRRAGKFSMGMGQRLGIGVALLGDPELLILDEPVNGLDPEGIVWIRTLMRSLAAEGRTVFVSSHLMAEMALTADHVIVIGKGRLLAEASVEDLIHNSAQNFVRVRSEESDKLAGLLGAQGGSSHAEADGALAVTGLSAAAIGDLAGAQGIVLHELSPQDASLEEAYLDLSTPSCRPRAGSPSSTASSPPPSCGLVINATADWWWADPDRRLRTRLLRKPRSPPRPHQLAHGGGTDAGLDGFPGAPDHRHPVGLGLLGHRNHEGQHPLVVGRLHMLPVEVLPHQELTGEGALGPLGDEDFLALLRLPGPFGPHGEHVLLNGEVDRVGVDPGEVEVDDEAVILAVGVHRHRGLMGGAGLLGEQLGEAVNLSGWVEAHEHGRSPSCSRATRGGSAGHG
jgi:ABC-2 type transport system ATP-binding protein